MIVPGLPCITRFRENCRHLRAAGRHDAASVAGVKSKNGPSRASASPNREVQRGDPGRMNAIARRCRQSAEARNPIPKERMRMVRIILAGAALVSLSAPRSARAQEKPESATEYQREELGVNPYTAPSVADIFQQLDDLKPLPFEQLKRDFPQAAHSGREQMGMVFGGLVADGFLIVECQKNNLVEDLGRVLFWQA